MGSSHEMNREEALQGVFTPPQLERFCRVFGVLPGELEPNFLGWYKRVVLSRNRAFLFPRDEAAVGQLEAELKLHAFLARAGVRRIPRFIARVRDPLISRYPFGVVARVRGVELCRVLGGMRREQFAAVMRDFARLAATWHRIPAARVARFLPRRCRKPAPVTVENWHNQVLNPAETGKVVRFIHRLAARRAGGAGRLAEEGTRRDWERVLGEIAALEPVIVAGDFHDGQIVLANARARRIRWVFDWGGARIDNPVAEFDFGEWDYVIFRRWSGFLDIRRGLWEEYLRRRSLSLSTPHGLHLYHTLCELMWIEMRRGERRIAFTRRNYADSVRLHLRRLAEVSALISGPRV